MEKSILQIPETVLNSGHKMPLIGFGCAAFPLPPLEELTAIFSEAIKTGYRHFDTAADYGSEEALGKPVAQAIEGGLVKNGREEFFITSKLSGSDADYDLVVPALKKTLGKLGLDYLDLYLVHWPLRFKKNASIQNFNPKEDLLPFDMHGTWKAMEECKNLGLVKSIGVSNFTCEKLQKLLEKATISPAVNQVEMNVGWQQRKLLPFCKQKGIHVSAWSPLGAYGCIWGINAVMESPVLKDIAASKNKTVAQVALRWIYEQGASVIVKSFNKERMAQNIEFFQFELAKEEVEQIEKIPQCRGIPVSQLTHPEGLIKSLDELWDGDLKLGLDYLDLYLIHLPIRFKQNARLQNFNPKEDLLPFDMHGTWKAMEECKNLGLVKSIGVSNFTCEKLQKLLEKATIPPVVNQVEMNVGWQQRKLLPFCKQKGIHVSAWSPLGAYGSTFGTNAVMESPILKDIVASENLTVAQVALRWIYKQGASMIVKSFNKQRMAQNLENFQFELTEEEAEQIEKIPQCRGNPLSLFIHPEGLIKSLEELWDGDL